MQCLVEVVCCLLRALGQTVDDVCAGDAGGRRAWIQVPGG
jgi:hypothetical protein